MRQKGVFGHHVTHGNVRQGQVPILFVPNDDPLKSNDGQ